MSSTLSDIVGTLGAVNAIITGESPVFLGDVQLTKMEVPDRISFGGVQNHVKHDFPGGGRVVDAMGAFDGDLQWSGYFQGSSAASRARRIDAMRQAGAAIRLSWADFTKRVVITEFTADYERRGNLIPYRISCVVLPSASVAAEPRLLERLAGDVGAALGVSKADVTGLMDSVTQATDAAQAALPLVGTIAGPKAMLAANDAIARASTASVGVRAFMDGKIGGLATSANAVGVGGTAGAVTAALAGAGALARSTTAAAYLGQAAARIRLG
ncbi:MAG: hypothetical protein DI601_00190 [Azospirillum brasilense]|nr:MAG: hypothetical protein DI601_00190 [Azospirillum brasilense]